MKQVKKLLVILPLVALFVLGSLPVLAADDPFENWSTFSFGLKTKTTEGEVVEHMYNVKLEQILNKGDLADLIDATLDTNDGKDATAVTSNIKNGLEAYLKTQAPGFKADGAQLIEAANKLAQAITVAEKKWAFTEPDELEVGVSKVASHPEKPADPEKPAEEKKCGLEKKDLKLEAKGVRIVAYDLHFGEIVWTRLNQLEMRKGWGSPKDYSIAFFNKALLDDAGYIYAGFATETYSEVVYRGAYLEAVQGYKDLFGGEYQASLVVFVVPKTLKVEVEHVFPEGTRDVLRETVSVPYDVWASLQHSSDFMNLNDLFKTRIQRVNEMGYAFREVKYFDGHREITGLLSSWDWANIPMGGERTRRAVARVFYDKAVAAAKEVPTEKKVDAATAPQAQIQAPAAQAPVTAANTTTTTAPVNTLPVTGASDSIFLFLSSAALMAVGILFFKKH